jgi:hypothetical protein
MDKSKDKRNSRLEAVKGYLLAAFPDDKLQVESYDGDLSWHITVIRAYQVVHEAWVMRPGLQAGAGVSVGEEEVSESSCRQFSLCS